MTAALVSAALFIGQEVMRVMGAPKEVKDLADTLKMLMPFLADAEQKQVKNGSVKAWLEQLQEISYDAEDVLDEWNTRILISEIPGDDVLYKGLNCLLSLCPCLKPVLVPYGIVRRIKDIREQLDMVAKGKEPLNLREGQGHQEKLTRPLTSSLVDESEIYGRDAIKETIVSQLLSESSRQDLPVPVISIVGTGGFGKTTLAQLILKQEQVVTKFQKTMWWVCVSEPFILEKVARDIIEQAEGKATDAVGWETLHKKLCEAVKGKLFLLVLDDIWSYDCKIWEPLKLSLDGGAPGSRIIVTTRHEDVVARKMSYLDQRIHRLEHLSNDDCWSLFRHIAFQERTKDVEELEKVGVKLAKKCKGVPLVAKMLASLMRFKNSPRDWRDVLESDIWEVLSEEEKGFLPELWLSYLALPSHLKQCFMYCAIFKKDVRMEKDELVKLWMAHGFLGFDGTEDLEKKGAGYFDNLAMRSFLQDFEKDGEGHIISCKMHDLVHDFAQFLTKCESPICDTNGQEFCYIRGRHLSAPNLGNSSISEQKNLRTLRPFDGSWDKNMPLGSFHQLACLRVLDLHGTALEELPVEVDRLLHLRYLDLSKTKLKELPETICNLLNLQTLKLNMCWYLRKLPQEIGKLYNLRHLEIDGNGSLDYLPQSIGRLRNLRTLSNFIVGGENEGCKIEELKLLDHLQGSLLIRIRGLEQVNNVAQAEVIKQKKNLRSLILDFSLESDGNQMEIVCEGLEPHSDLEKLVIRYYRGPRFPLWMSSLSKVRKLELFDCRQCLQLPCLGNLASLEDLTLTGLSSVKHIGCEFYGGDSTSTGNIFPRLTSLEISNMKELERLEFPVSKDRRKIIMPLLSHLNVHSCGKLRALAFPKDEESFPLLRKLVIEWCGILQELTGVGKLKSLEELKLYDLKSVERLGMDFLGISSMSDGDGDSVLIFPKLMRLQFSGMCGLQEWVMPFKKDTENFPNLVYLELCCCCLQSLPALGRPKSLETPILGTSHELAEWEWVVPALGKLKSLQTLKLRGLNSVGNPWSEFLGISSDNGSAEIGESVPVEVFPHLTHLELANMPNWEQEEEIHQIEKYQGGLTKIMPCLHTLEIDCCPKLKVVPQYMFSHSLKYLKIKKCPELTGMQPCFPPLLEKLTLSGNVGFLSRSLPISNDYPNLKFFEIDYSPYSSLPEGFNRLTSIQEMTFNFSGDLEFMPEELKHHTMLRQVEIFGCPILSEHCRKRENWSTTSSIPKIIIDWDEISFSQ